MVLSSKLRVTENIKNRMDEVVKAIKRGAACPYVYCITLPSCKQNLLDIHPYHELYKRKEYEEPFFILGLAENRASAVELVRDMAAEVALMSSRPEDYRQNFISLRDSFFEMRKDETGDDTLEPVSEGNQD